MFLIFFDDLGCQSRNLNLMKLGSNPEGHPRRGSSIQSWILERNLHSATFNGCAVGVEADGQPAKLPWRFVTSSWRLATNLAAH